MRRKKAFFRFEASPSIGAGHAIRSSVVADILAEKGWEPIVITSSLSYEFIKHLERFERVDPIEFYKKPSEGDLLVIDHYDLGEDYEKHFRPLIHKILVIDDLANRKHDCDILLDQTYGRESSEYKSLVPEYCKVLTGGDYVLLRKEFIELRPKALQKRRNTVNINKILVSMGGSDPNNSTLKALQMIKDANFNGAIDVVLGFDAIHYSEIKKYLDGLSNPSMVYLSANMAQLIYDADLSIGAAGSSLWERHCLGILTVPIILADNQISNFIALKQLGQADPLLDLLAKNNPYAFHKTVCIDGFGINRLLEEIGGYNDDTGLTLRRVTELDKNKIYYWQNIKGVRQYFNNPSPPSLEEHDLWFSERIKQTENPYWIICYENQECGVISLTYNEDRHYYELSWFIIPEYRGRGLGTKSVSTVLHTIYPFKIYAYVKKDNIASNKVFKKLGFEKIDECAYISR